ncbi:restriction endonuclease subunit S [Escherichia coli]|uniref:restriction endonuclease subunit S n=1 Tax=Escherichia coli TaxID=562 RepID=UPI000C7B054F|nr:restriction endonuclease subunit S [Escherichia coli]EEQ1550489.1 restriction endonuclease subunit S [Escherichia coli]EFB4368695.1 restriction endonuclease subunit S [Escherichia coli]EFB9245967.1 restriction endonuclease subunit S [Escherichia coli]EFD9718614.1 restriction endonuclease subunit S [Escherichia coli]EFE5132233.1 restriction endonuclease subunit S [Escherichia coli]
MVPKGWTLGTLKDLADTIMGYAFRSEDFVPTGIPLLRMGNLYQNTLDLNRNPVYLPDSFKVDYKRFLVSPGDLVMSMTGTMGKRDYGFTVEIPSNTQCSLLNQRVLKIVPKNNASSGYILNLLRSELILSVLYSFPGGTKQANLSAKQLQELPVLIPPELEQKKIAQILSTWDKAISVTEKLLTNSQQQKKALMQQLLTGKKRLLDENGVRFSGEWKQDVNLGSIINISKGVQINKNTLSEDGQFPVINGGIAPSGFTSEFNTDENTITISEGGNSCGYVAFQKKSFWCGGHCYAVRKTALDLSFTFHLLKYNELKIMGLRVGSGLPNIQKKAIEAFTVNFPVTSVEQQKIAAVLSAADDEIATLEKKLACLRDEKKALMQQLLTGKRRVKVDEAVAE